VFRRIVSLRVLREIVSFLDNFAAIPAFISSFLPCDETVDSSDTAFARSDCGFSS